MVPAHETIRTKSGTWLQEQLLSIEIDCRNHVLKLEKRNVLFVKKASLAVRDLHNRSIKPGGAGHGYEELCDFLRVSIPVGQNVSHPIISYDVLLLFFFPAAIALKRKIADLLHPFIELAQPHARFGFTANGLHGRFFD